MRALLAILTATALLTAGCLDGGGPGASSTEDGEDALPPPLHDTQVVQMTVNPLTTVQGPACGSQASACFHYPIQLDAATSMAAELSWEDPTNDLDLFLFHDGERMASSAQAPPGTQETLEGVLDPGEYDLVVVAWLVPEDTYTLDVTFSSPG